MNLNITFNFEHDTLENMAIMLLTQKFKKFVELLLFGIRSIYSFLPFKTMD